MNSTPQNAVDALPREEAAASRPEFTRGGLLSRLDPGASLIRHRRLAFVLFSLIALAGLPIAYFKGQPAYHTQAVVFISPRFIGNPQGGEEFQLQSNAQYREYVQRNVRTINRFDIVLEALKQLGDKGKRSWRRPREDDRSAAERLAGALTISAAPDTYQVIVGLDGDQPEGLAELVNTLVDVYIGVQKSEEFNGVESRVAALKQEMDSLGKEIADSEARRTQLARAMGVSTFTGNYVNPYDQRLAAAKQALAEARRRRIAAEAQAGAADPANAQHLSSTNAQLAERAEKALEAEAARQESQAALFTRNYQEGLGLGQRIKQALKRQESAEQRRRFLDLETKAPGLVRVFAKAQPARRSAKGGPRKLALIFVLTGLVTAVLVPVAVDIADPRLFVPSDAGRALGFDPIGWLPERKEGGEEFTWELILRLAHRIDQERQVHGTRIWMFTSVKSGGGTTTLVNSLGKALSILGVPALSVEGNAYRADGRFARNSAGPGLTALLRGRSSLSESIETADREMPDHIPVGELDGSGHLPDIHRLMEILGAAAESYALVLVDMPPVLDSVDSEYLARRSGCVVLVAEARRVTGPELKRAARALKRVEPKSVACVLNRVRDADGRGFAQEAKREFETGVGNPRPAWQQPWLWK